MGGPSEAGDKFIVCTHNRIFYVLDNEVAFFISGSLLCHANEWSWSIIDYLTLLHCSEESDGSVASESSGFSELSEFPASSSSSPSSFFFVCAIR